MINIKVFKNPLPRLERDIMIIAKAATKLLKVTEDIEVNLVFITGKEMKKMNKDYRGKDKVTDVLSFSYNEGRLKGEIYICETQAKKQSDNLEVEILFLFTHGLLHIFSYTHEDDQAEEKMNMMAKRILVEAGGKK